MTRPSLRDRWLRVLDATPYEVLACCPKYTLRGLADDMTADGYLTVNRAESADRLNRNERTIQRHLQHAIDAKLLDRVRRGQKGVYSRYRAMLPDIQRDIQGDDLTTIATAKSRPQTVTLKRPSG